MCVKKLNLSILLSKKPANSIIGDSLSTSPIDVKLLVSDQQQLGEGIVLVILNNIVARVGHLYIIPAIRGAGAIHQCGAGILVAEVNKNKARLLDLRGVYRNLLLRKVHARSVTYLTLCFWPCIEQ